MTVRQEPLPSAGMIRIRLSWPEVIIATNGGVLRNIHALKNHYTPGNDPDPELAWDYTIEGCCGELAVAKHFGLFWDASVGVLAAADVGPFQVKCNRSRRWDDLILRTTDKPGYRYISVLGFCPDYYIVGWIEGGDAMVDKWWRDPTGHRPAWFVPRSALNSIADLKL